MKALNLLIPVFISGACAMVVELGGSRIIAPYLGTTIYTWAAVIGLVLAALSLGYYYGGNLADKYKDRKYLARIFFFAAFCTLLIPVIAKFILPFTLLFPLAIASIISALILVPASVFYGMVSPYAIRLLSEGVRIGRSSGEVFALSTVGSIAGTLGTGFLLIPYFSITWIFVGAAVAMIGCGFLVHKKMNPVDVCMFCLFLFPAGFMSFALYSSGNLVYQTNSEYYTISVYDNITIGNGSTRVLRLDDAYSTGEYPDGSPAFGYVIEAREAYNISKNPKRALVIGVGGGTQVEELKKAFPDMMVDGVEIDRKVIQTGETYFSLKKDNRTDIIIDDGRRFVKTTDRKYDLVVIDVFRGKGIPSHMTTLEFVKELKNVTNPNAVVIINVISTFDGEKSRFLQLIYNTYSEEFSNVMVMPLGSEPDKSQNIILIATDADVSDFVAMNPGKIREYKPATNETITDDKNPSEIMVQ